MDKVNEVIKLGEGSVIENGKHRPYQCPADKLTIGWGHNLEDNGINDVTAEFLLSEDVFIATQDLKAVLGSDVWMSLSEVRNAALVDMIFNLGRPTFSKFQNMIAAIKAADWQKASAEAIDSRWYRQVGSRGQRIVKMLSSNEWPEELEG